MSKCCTGCLQIAQRAAATLQPAVEAPWLLGLGTGTVWSPAGGSQGWVCTACSSPGGSWRSQTSWGSQTSWLSLPACSPWWSWLRLAGRNVDGSRHLFCSRGCVYFRSTECLSFCNRNASRLGVPRGLPKNWANCKLKGNGVAKNRSVCEGQT